VPSDGGGGRRTPLGPGLDDEVLVADRFVVDGEFEDARDDEPAAA
jgi:hypothetical protein